MMNDDASVMSHTSARTIKASNVSAAAKKKAKARLRRKAIMASDSDVSIARTDVVPVKLIAEICQTFVKLQETDVNDAEVSCRYIERFQKLVDRLPRELQTSFLLQLSSHKNHRLRLMDVDHFEEVARESEERRKEEARESEERRKEEVRESEERRKEEAQKSEERCKEEAQASEERRKEEARKSEELVEQRETEVRAGIVKVLSELQDVAREELLASQKRECENQRKARSALCLESKDDVSPDEAISPDKRQLGSPNHSSSPRSNSSSSSAASARTKAGGDLLDMEVFVYKNFANDGTAISLSDSAVEGIHQLVENTNDKQELTDSLKKFFNQGGIMVGNCGPRDLAISLCKGSKKERDSHLRLVTILDNLQTQAHKELQASRKRLRETKNQARRVLGRKSKKDEDPDRVTPPGKRIRAN